MTLYLGGLYAQPAFCPADSLLSGFVETQPGLGASAFIGASVALTICIGLVVANRIAFISDFRRRLAYVLGPAFAVMALAIWLRALFSYFCVDGQGIALLTPFTPPARYEWAEISNAAPACSHRGRRQITERIFTVKLELSDGQQATIGFRASRTREHYAELKRKLTLMPWTHDWMNAIPCPDDFRTLFTRIY